MINEIDDDEQGHLCCQSNTHNWQTTFMSCVDEADLFLKRKRNTQPTTKQLYKKSEKKMNYACFTSGLKETMLEDMGNSLRSGYIVDQCLGAVKGHDL